MKIIYNIIAKILGFSVEKLDNGALIHFPIWSTQKMRQSVLDNLKKDYEIKNNKFMKIDLGHRWARLEYNE